MEFLCSMKKIIITAMLLITAWTCALAQSDKAEVLEKYQANRAKLNLTEEQAKKVRGIDSVYLKGMEGLKNSGGSKLSKLKKFKSLTSTKDEQMKAILDKEQYKTYQEQQKEMKAAVKNKRRSN